MIGTPGKSPTAGITRLLYIKKRLRSNVQKCGFNFCYREQGLFRNICHKHSHIFSQKEGELHS